MTPSHLQTEVLRAAKILAARSPFILSWILTKMSFALPVDRLVETSQLLAFPHPNPSYPVHILIVPKKGLASLGQLEPEADGDFLRDLYNTVQQLVGKLHLAEEGYRLIVNGGKYQEFPYLHFHLVSGQPNDRK